MFCDVTCLFPFSLNGKCHKKRKLALSVEMRAIFCQMIANIINMACHKKDYCLKRSCNKFQTVHNRWGIIASAIRVAFSCNTRQPRLITEFEFSFLHHRCTSSPTFPFLFFLSHPPFTINNFLLPSPLTFLGTSKQILPLTLRMWWEGNIRHPPANFNNGGSLPSTFLHRAVERRYFIWFQWKWKQAFNVLNYGGLKVVLEFFKWLSHELENTTCVPGTVWTMSSGREAHLGNCKSFI